MSNLREIAIATGVCVETVSRVLNGKYKGRTKDSRAMMRLIKKEAERVNYRPNNAARAMRTNSTGLIGVVIEEGGLRTYPVFTEILQGADQVLKESGYVLTVSSLNGIEETTLDSRIFKEHLIDGLLVFDTAHEQSPKKMIKAISNCVLVNTNTWLPYGCVRRDEYATGKLAGNELKKLGYKKAFYFDSEYTEYEPKVFHYSSVERLKGFLESFSGEGLETTVVGIGTGGVLAWLEEYRCQIKPDSVVIAGQNLRLFCLISALAQIDLKAGIDFGLASLDDETGLLASFPAVSRVSFPRVEIGKIAGQMLIDLIAGNKNKCQSVKIKGEWIAGETTKKVTC